MSVSQVAALMLQQLADFDGLLGQTERHSADLRASRLHNGGN